MKSEKQRRRRARAKVRKNRSSVEIARDEAERTQRVTDLVRSVLLAAVPLWIADMLDKPDEYITRRAAICSQHVAEHGDVLQYKVKGKTAAAFNHLAEGLACGAMFVPGGIDFLGLHFEVPLDWRLRREEARLGRLSDEVRRLQETLALYAENLSRFAEVSS